MLQKGWTRLTLFPKLVLALLIVVAPLYAVGLLANRTGADSIRRELNQSMQAKTDFYLSSLESEKAHITNLEQEILIDADLQRLTFITPILSPFDWTQTVSRVENKLQLIRGSSEYIQNVSVHMMTLGRTISSNKPITDSISADYEAVRPSGDVLANDMISWRGRMFLAMQYPDPARTNRPPSYIVSVEWSVPKLQAALRQFTQGDRSGALLYHPSDGWLVGNGQGGGNREDVGRFLKRQYDAGVLQGVRTIRLGDSRSEMLLAYEYSTFFRAYLAVYTPSDSVLGHQKSFVWIYWALSVLSTLVIIVYSYWLYRLLHRPLILLIRSFRRMEEGQLTPIVLPRGRDEFYSLFTHFNRMTERLGKLIHQVYEQRLRAQTSELKQLQSQINPHFLYNTYFILYRLAKMNDIDKVTALSHHLGEYFQYITRNAAAEVPLQDEVNHSRTYVDIQNIRFAKRIAVEFDELPEACRQLPVPRLVLQPIVENAYHYGMEGKRRDGRIAVWFAWDGRRLTATVEDNGEMLTDATLDEVNAQLLQSGGDIEHTGLINVHRRLRLRYGEGSGIRLSRSPLGGLRVDLTIDYEKAAEGEWPDEANADRR